MLSAHQKTLFIAWCANSTPKKVAALAGTALAIAGPIPGKNALMPPREWISRIVPPMLRLPSPDCMRDLIVSTGKTLYRNRAISNVSQIHEKRL